jgi:hypothetical protein
LPQPELVLLLAQDVLGLQHLAPALGGVPLHHGLEVVHVIAVHAGHLGRCIIGIWRGIMVEGLYDYEVYRDEGRITMV